jgi:hypothetical protein
MRRNGNEWYVFSGFVYNELFEFFSISNPEFLSFLHRELLRRRHVVGGWGVVWSESVEIIHSTQQLHVTKSRLGSILCPCMVWGRRRSAPPSADLDPAPWPCTLTGWSRSELAVAARSYRRRDRQPRLRQDLLGPNKNAAQRTEDHGFWIPAFAACRPPWTVDGRPAGSKL